MRYRIYSESEMITKSRELIHTFMKRQMDFFTELLHPNFVWLGDYSYQYIKGKDNFLKTITSESTLPPLEFSQEEYSCLTHERHTWITYGRCLVTATLENDQKLASGIHFTFVWKQEENDMYLLQASANHVQDEQLQELPDNVSILQNSDVIPQARVFDHVKPEVLSASDQQKLKVRDDHGSLHFLSASEIIYAQCSNKYCTIITDHGTLTSYMPLKNLELDGFIRIHTSFLINKNYARSIKRYELTLRDGTTLPVGKERYKNIVEQLSK